MRLDEESKRQRGEALEKKLLIRLCELQGRLLSKSSGRMFPNGMDRLMRLDEVLNVIGVSESTIRRWEQAGRFPRRRRLGERAMGWFASEVAAWLNKPTVWQLKERGEVTLSPRK
jgi:prophage regulatory protein